MKPCALWLASWPLRARPICTMPKPSRIAPMAFDGAGTQSRLRLLMVVSGSSAKAGMAITKQRQPPSPPKIKALDFAVSHLGRIERSFLHFHNNFPPGVFLSSRAVRTFLRDFGCCRGSNSTHRDSDGVAHIVGRHYIRLTSCIGCIFYIFG